MADAVVGLVLDKLTALISDQVGVFYSAKKELENLKSEMIAIRSTMKVADGLPYFMVEGLKDWLQKLKDVAYDAEDIIDKYQAKINQNKQVCSPFVNYFPSSCDNHIRLRYKLGKDIKAINETLAQISKEKDRYHNILHEFATRSLQITNDRATSCFIDKKDIIGRENDQTTLIQKLVGEDTTTCGGGCNVSIISIVGIGGVGKTTLAQMIFDNDQVKKHFGESMWWVSILQRPNAIDVTKRIVEQIKKDEVNVSELNTLIQLVHSTTSKNKFLLVLDDVWDLDWWERLEHVLVKKGAPGSRIIMTSRKEHISKGIGAAYMLELESFTHEKSWELFLREALITEDELKRLNLEEIGRNIVSKCGGLPLVIQTVGKVMQSKERRREDWEFIANSKIWDLKIPSTTSDSSLLPGLVLSYDDLSPILKHYFTYFSLYQKGVPLYKLDFIMNLMAHGLVENANERNMEVAANHHIDDMVGRRLFQLTNPDGLSLQMHDTVHDLATHVAGKEYAHNYVNENTRHLAIRKHLSSLDEIGLQRNHVLRTFLCLKPLSENPLDKYINNLKMLRVLDLTGGSFTKIPDSIGDLLLLKHLDLRDTTIKQLPASIGKLQNLLSLLLDGSEIQELPKEIGQLCNLRHLGLENTHQLEFVAEGLGKVTCLRTLSRFIICHANKATVGCNVKELKNLINLKGELTIENLERVTLINDASEALLQEKKDIESLNLSFGKIIIGEETSEEEKKKIAEDQEQLLQELQLPPNLKSLSLTRYCGKKLPIDWLDGCVHLETIKFQSCSWIEKLPSFTMFKCLHLHDCHHLKTLAASPCLEEFVIDGCASFTQLPFCPKLESVEMSNLDNWEGFEKGAEKYCIKTLKISNCLKVKSMPHLPSLQRLEINFCDELSALLEKEEAEFELNMPALTELEIRGCPALVELPDMPILTSLTMVECHRLKQLTFMGKLEKLKVRGCENWEGWSLERKENATLPFMHELDIYLCPKLRALPSFPALTDMKIHSCEELRALWREDDQPIGLEVISMHRCPNVSFQVDWLLPLTKIRDLMMDGPLCCLHVTTSHIEALQRLRALGFICLPSQTLLPEWLWRLSSLEILILGFSGATSSLQGPWEKLKQLEFLTICNLEVITLDGLFKHSPHSRDQPTEEQCSPSERTHLSVPPKLEWLSFIGCSNLKLLPDGLQHLIHLKVLALNDLPELASLPQCLTRLPKLEGLEIRNCPTLPDGLQHLVHLKALRLIALPELASLPQCLTTLPKLEELLIVDCPKLAFLPAGLEVRLGNGLEVSGNCPLLLGGAT
ncbi:disease resistance protein RGA2-like [Nymphaea colorata]|nr:disease resistance protein RGA2-like [Nymphaea colorata]XP_031505721.1 disease resistance protein RGA2-like [Nymphaea colorata]XP_049931573.1 disease resistance protein RGA2-like [Nymphaea colorata]XP_049931574.1 disease resistance protein RGA2-like [Nymphaea colorata]XP_049931575.1 disease resistance protein RGA2-like [Nymphaea colorata]